MRTNPFLDAWLFLVGDTGDHNALGVWKWIFVILFFALLIASFVIAARNWQEDPRQRTTAHVFTFVSRLMVGCMWFQGMLWKMPLFSRENGLFYWTGQMAEHAAFQIHRDLVTNVVLPAFLLVNPLVFLTELAFAVSLMLGIGVRFIGLVGVAFLANLWLGLYRHPAEWPWTYVFLALLMGGFTVYAAGRSLGLDAMLRRRDVGARWREGRFNRPIQIAT